MKIKYNQYRKKMNKLFKKIKKNNKNLKKQFQLNQDKQICLKITNKC